MGERTGFPRGRPPGARNKATRERERALMDAERRLKASGGSSSGAFMGDALSLLCSVYKCVDLDLSVRIDAAKTAVRYERPPLAPVLPVVSPEDEAAKAQRLHKLLQDMKETVGSG